MRLALAVLVASCVDTAPGFKLPVPATPGMIELGPFHFADATDDVHNTCAPAGARDVSFELTVDANQTVMFDTDPDPTKTTTAVAMSLFDGPCPAKQMIGCTIGRCPGTAYGSLEATLLADHTFCLVVEQSDPASASDLVTIRMFTSGRVASMVFDGNPNTMPGSTCTGDAEPPLSCGAQGNPWPSSVALVAVCPGMHPFVANVMLTGTPVAFSLRPQLPQGPELACFPQASNGGFGTGAILSGPQPFWLVMERVMPSSCGSFQLSVMAQ